MSARYALTALLLGVIGFVAVELAGGAAGVRTALTPFAWLDALCYALATLLLAAAFRPTFGRVRGIKAAFAMLVFLLLYAPVAGALGGALDLTATGGWAFPSEVRGAFTATPVNLLLTFVLDLWYVALPLGVISVVLLWRIAPRPRGLTF